MEWLWGGEAVALRSQVPAVAQARKLQAAPVEVMTHNHGRSSVGLMQEGFLEGSLLCFRVASREIFEVCL